MLAGCYPGDKDPQIADSKLQGLGECGVTCMVNLMEPGEVNLGGPSFVPYENRLYELARTAGLTDLGVIDEEGKLAGFLGESEVAPAFVRATAAKA